MASSTVTGITLQELLSGKVAPQPQGARLDGVLLAEPAAGRLQLRENVTLHWTSPAYPWVNTLQIWATGWLEIASGRITLRGYEA